MNFSLMNPNGTEKSYQVLPDEAINDLSIDFILEALTEKQNERPHLRGMLIRVPMDPEIIRYRHDVFEDFLRFPELRKAMTELTLKLSDLRDLERFQMDSDTSALWSLINRLREIDDYIDCINMIKATLNGLDITSKGMRDLRDIVTDIARESGFDELKADIKDMMDKARRLKSVTIGVNLDKLLRPEFAGIVSLNDTKFTDSGILSRFKGFTDQKDDLHHGTNLGEGRRYHPSTPYNSRCRRVW